MKYITPTYFIFTVSHPKKDAILQKSSIIDKVVTKLLIYYLSHFKLASILKQTLLLWGLCNYKRLFGRARPPRR